MPSPSLLSRSLLALSMAAALVGCGGGGGGGGGGVASTPSVPPGQFGVTAGPNGAKIQGLNLPVNLQFSKAVAPASASALTIKVVSVADPTGVSSAPPGHFADATFSVTNAIVTITPKVEFTPVQVEYGFLANALYEIAFSPPNGGLAVTSTTGENMVNSTATFFFRTPAKGFDFNPGYPAVQAFIVDDPDTPGAPPIVLPPEIVESGVPDGDLVPEAIAFFTNSSAPGDEPIPITPLPSTVLLGTTVSQAIVFIFNDAVIPTTVVNPINGSSPSIDVAINAATPPILFPKTLPAEYAVIHQQGDLTIVLWQTGFMSFPPGAFLFVEVHPTVQDLAGNSKQSLTGSGDSDLSALLSVDDLASSFFELVEPFEDVSQRDASATSADWGAQHPTSGAFVLAPVLGGGTGEDGLLVIDPAATALDAGDTEVPPNAVLDFDTKTAYLPSVAPATGGFEPREWAFSTISIPAGWTLTILTDRDDDGTLDPDEYLVQSPGHPLDGLGAPLLLRCTGLIDIAGTIDVSGSAGITLVRPTGTGDPLYADYKAQGGEGGLALLAAGTGGPGGDVLLLDDDGDVVFPLISPSPDFQSSDGKLRGVTGLSSGLTATTLTDAARSFTQLTDPGDTVLPPLLAAGEIRLQPNLGVGSSLVGNAGTPNQDIDENHPTFVLAGVTDDATVSVTGAFGDLNQPSENFGTLYAPIAAAGDAYLVGRLHGLTGEDEMPLLRAGFGAEPFVVVNYGLGVTTTGGGGGGGGGIDGGLAGTADGPESDPFVNQQNTSHGIAKDESVGAAGGQGTVRGAVTPLNDGITLLLDSQSAGRPLAELTTGELVGSLIIPNVPDDGWMFRIADFDGTSFTIDPVTGGGESIDLLDGPGFLGPALLPGTSYDFMIVPSLEVGGAGGGGSGVSITGTLNTATNVLPRLTPGAGGGSGGGSLLLETASTMVIGDSARLLAQGGEGGVVSDALVTYAGGGGGGGGNLVVRAGALLNVIPGAELSVAGGVGGSDVEFGQGGTGGAGFIRFENFADTLTPASLAGATTPPVTDVNIGRMFGSPQGVGQSLFYPPGLVHPEWTSATVTYWADTDGDEAELYHWRFTELGAVSQDELLQPFPDGLADPPLRLQFNTVGFNSDGLLDQESQSNVFYEAYDLVSARVGLAHDPADDVLLYTVGEGCNRVHRLDPGTLGPALAGPAEILLPIIPSVGSDTLDLLAIAAGGVDDELYLLERDTFRVHVIALATGAFRRTIQLPVVVTGAMTYLPAPIDRLVIADNRNDQLLTFRPRDPGGSLTLDYAPAAAEDQYDLRRDGTLLDTELVGLAWDAASEQLWCSDARAGRLFQISLAAGSEGLSDTGSESFSTLRFDAPGAPPAVNVVPSAVAFDGSTLFLVHAIDRTVDLTAPIDPHAGPRVQDLTPAQVDPTATGADTVLTGFGEVLPEGPAAIGDGDPFLRFKLLIDGEKVSGATSFTDVGIDTVEFVAENDPF